MSKYTTEVRYICEVNSGLVQSAGFNDIQKILESSVDKIFNFDYPIFDESYRRPLNIKILRHFYTREIGAETVGEWKLYLQQTLEEIMPYYNQLYLSEIESINPLYNVDITTTREKTGDSTENASGHTTTNTNGNEHRNEYGQTNKNKTGSDKDDYTNTVKKTGTGTDTKTVDSQTTEKGKDVETGKSNTKHIGSDASEKKTTANNTNYQNEVANNKDRYSDTPQGGLEGMNAIDSNMYLTNARLVDNTRNATTTDVSSGKENYKGSENYTDNTTDSTTTNKTNQTNEKEKQSGTTKTTADETGKKTGTKTYNENETGSANKSATIDSENNKLENHTENTKINTTEQYLEHVKGYRGTKTFSEILIEWRKSFLNIDKMILDDLDDCFMQLW